MQILGTGIEGLVQILPKFYKDHRGWFVEAFKQSSFEGADIGSNFCQDNLSYSNKGVLRGLHFQGGVAGQAKFVMVLSGKVLDVVVDLRPGSVTFGKTFQLELDSKLRNCLYIPEGFAHGFSALEDSLFLYKCSREYNPKTETGIIWNDPDLKINWGIDNPIISDKDKELPTFQELLRNSVISQ